jgi:hypothetical protein
MPASGASRDKWDKKRCYFQKRTGEVIENKGSAQKTNRNEPKNEAEKLLKTRSCGKNEPENEATDLVENKRWRKNEPKTNRRKSGNFSAAPLALQVNHALPNRD